MRKLISTLVLVSLLVTSFGTLAFAGSSKDKEEQEFLKHIARIEKQVQVLEADNINSSEIDEFIEKNGFIIDRVTKTVPADGIFKVDPNKVGAVSVPNDLTYGLETNYQSTYKRWWLRGTWDWKGWQQGVSNPNGYSWDCGYKPGDYDLISLRIESPSSDCKLSTTYYQSCYDTNGKNVTSTNMWRRDAYNNAMLWNIKDESATNYGSYYKTDHGAVSMYTTADPVPKNHIYLDFHHNWESNMITGVNLSLTSFSVQTKTKTYQWTTTPLDKYF